MKPLVLKNDEYKEDYKTSNKDEWEYAVCPICGSDEWKVIFTAKYETSAQCVKCQWMDTVRNMKDTCPCENCITKSMCRHKSYGTMLKNCDFIYNYLYVVNSMEIKEGVNFKKKIYHAFTHLRPSLWSIKDVSNWDWGY